MNTINSYCQILTFKNWAKLKHNSLISAKFLKELQSTCIIILPLYPGGAEVQRLYPSGNSTNRSHACAGSDEVILTCHGRGSNITWIATSDSVDIGRIIFFSSDAEGTIVSQGIIRGFLIDVDSNNNLVSELRVHTTPSMRPISIVCSSQVGRSTHLIAPAGMRNNYYSPIII